MGDPGNVGFSLRRVAQLAFRAGGSHTTASLGGTILSIRLLYPARHVAMIAAYWRSNLEAGLRREWLRLSAK